MTEEEVVDEVQDTEKAQTLYLSEIMRQLVNSERFMRFFKINYEVQTYFDKQNETFDIRLIELPPELASKRLNELVADHVETHTPKVETASLVDIAVINDLASFKEEVNN